MSVPLRHMCLSPFCPLSVPFLSPFCPIRTICLSPFPICLSLFLYVCPLSVPFLSHSYIYVCPTSPYVFVPFLSPFCPICICQHIESELYAHPYSAPLPLEDAALPLEDVAGGFSLEGLQTTMLDKQPCSTARMATARMVTARLAARASRKMKMHTLPLHTQVQVQRRVCVPFVIILYGAFAARINTDIRSELVVTRSGGRAQVMCFRCAHHGHQE